MLNFHHALKSVDFYKKIVIREMLCVEYQCLDQREYFDFWIDCPCLVYCTQGKKIYSTNGEDHWVEKDSVFFMKKGAYSGKNFLEENYCALMFFMPESFFQQFFYRHTQLKLTPGKNASEHQEIIPIQMDTILEVYFASMLAYFAQPVEPNKKLLEIKLEELLLNIFTQPRHKKLACYLSSIGRGEAPSLRTVVESNFASNLKLEEYAELCHLSLSSFKRQFNRIYGESPGKWLLRRKLELTRRLLSYSEKPVNEIAFQCGFESTSHFIRVFKKQYGVTPLKFRQQGAEVY